MQKKGLLVFAACAALLVAACGGPASEETAAPDMHNAANSLDYAGVYEGLLPAADGPGIQTTLTLNKDNTFTLRSEYVDQEDGVFNDAGSFTLDGNVLTLDMDGQPYYYRVEEGRVRMLDMDKKPVTGALADNYVLEQTEVFIK